eukprot:364168-Chlamydomonas_euryale.AAC.5
MEHVLFTGTKGGVPTLNQPTHDAMQWSQNSCDCAIACAMRNAIHGFAFVSQRQRQRQRRVRFAGREANLGDAHVKRNNQPNTTCTARTSARLPAGGSQGHMPTRNMHRGSKTKAADLHCNIAPPGAPSPGPWGSSTCTE